jgi:cytochrome P450
MPKLRGFAKVPIPGPRPIPVVGRAANLLRFLGDPVGRMLALQRDHGDIAAVNGEDPALVCAFGAENTRAVLSDPATFRHDTGFPFRAPPGSALSRTLGSLVFLNGEAHHRHRRLMAPAFSKASVDGYAGEIVAAAEASLRAWPVGQTTDVSVLLRRLTASVALRALFGLEAGPDADELHERMTRLVSLLASPAVAAFPFDAPGTPFHQALLLAVRIEALVRRLIDQKRRCSAHGDVLSRLLDSRDEEGAALTDDEVFAEMVTLFSAGHDTSAQTLAWTLFLLAHRPDLLAALDDEIHGVLHGAPPTPEKAAKLVLVDRVLKESMRILPATPLLHLRVATGEALLGPYRLPPEANVVVSPFITHRDPGVYPEPARFRPERWEHLSPSHHAYLPFGAGPRMCLGAGFATLSLRLLLPMILQRYRLSLAWGARISRRMGGIVLRPKHGMPMLVALRDRCFPRPQAVRGDVLELLDLS